MAYASVIEWTRTCQKKKTNEQTDDNKETIRFFYQIALVIFFPIWGELFRPAELMQTPILIPVELNSKGEKCSFPSNCLQKNVIIIYALGSVHEKFGV